MATKPTVRIPLWASTGSKTDPGAGQEADGWDPGDRPPANWINWIYNAFGQWLGYFEDRTDLSPVVIGRAISGASAAVSHCSAALAATPIVFWDSGFEMRIYFASAVVGTQAVVTVSGGTSHQPAAFTAKMYNTSTLSIYAFNTYTGEPYDLSSIAITEINFVIHEVP